MFLSALLSRAHGNGNTGWCTPKFIPALTTEPLWFLAKLQAVPRTQISTLWWSQPRSCCSRAPVAALCAQGSTFNPYNSALFPALPELQTLPHIPLECCKSLLVPLDEPHPGEASPPCIPRWHLGLWNAWRAPAPPPKKGCDKTSPKDEPTFSCYQVMGCKSEQNSTFRGNNGKRKKENRC